MNSNVLPVLAWLEDNTCKLLALNQPWNNNWEVTILLDRCHKITSSVASSYLLTPDTTRLHLDNGSAWAIFNEYLAEEFRKQRQSSELVALVIVGTLVISTFLSHISGSNFTSRTQNYAILLQVFWLLGIGDHTQMDRPRHLHPSFLSITSPTIGLRHQCGRSLSRQVPTTSSFR